jgi:tetrahydromethanopterin S-methyltransferase subunit G
VVSKDPDKMESILKGPDKLEREIEAVCAVKYQLIRSKVNKGIARSIIYIFVTKVLLAVVVELPYEYYFLGHIKYLSLTANLLIPPSLMFFLGLTIKKPGEENTRRIVETTHDIVYETEKQPKIRVNMGRNSKQTVAYRAFVVIYILLFMVCFSSFSYLLYRLNFGLVGGLIFFMFLSLVLLFGYRVRFAASEYKVTTEREGFLSHVLSNLTLPFLNLGVWLSSRMSQFNFIVVFLDFIIEAPLKATMEGVDRWTAFIKEKREEVVEVPAD